MTHLLIPKPTRTEMIPLECVRPRCDRVKGGDIVDKVAVARRIGLIEASGQAGASW